MWFALIGLASSILQSVFKAANKDGLSELAASIQIAITAIEQIHQTDVTKNQLESLRG